jgi:hypothetical protein
MSVTTERQSAMTTWLDRIQRKIGALRAIEGASDAVGRQPRHDDWAPPLALAELEGFEARHGVRLPSAYRAFLTCIAAEGPGPGYGLLPLDMVVCDAVAAD